MGSIVLNNSNTDWLQLRTPCGTLAAAARYSARDQAGTLIQGRIFTPASGASRAMLVAALDDTILADANWRTTPTGTTYGLGDRGTPGSGPYTPLGPQDRPGVVASVEITPSVPTIARGGTRAMSATGRDAAGREACAEYAWSSSDEAVATVDRGSGLVTGVSVGEATITAATPRGVSGSTLVTVVEPGPKSISLATNNPARMPAGYTKPLFPTVRDQSDAVITGVSLQYSSSDEGIATVDELGYVAGVRPGTATIRATASNGVAGTIAFTVIDADAPTTAQYGNHVEFGTPTDGTPTDDILISKRGYALS
jgi:hypothetical protein